MLSSLLVTVWIILVCVSQYFMNWFQFGKTGLIVIGVVGFIGAVLWLFSGYYRSHPNPNAPTWL